MMGKDRKKMAEEASANLQKLGLSGPMDEQSEFDNVIDTFTQVEANKDHAPPSGGVNTESELEGGGGGANSDSNSQSDSVRRKSFLNSGLNIGLDLEVPTEQTDLLENVLEDTEEYKEQWEGGGEEYYNNEGSVYDQSLTQSQNYDGENEK
jgi:hypothetical protein